MTGSLELGMIDFATIGVYFVLLLVIGIISTGKKKNLDEYFFAGRSMGWFVIGGAIFATNIGSEHIIGLAANGYEAGFSNSNIEIMAVIPLMLLGWFIAPYFLKNKIKTIPEYIEKRYGKFTKWLIIVTSLIAYIITKIGISLYSGAYLLKTLLGWDLYTASVVMVLLTGVYTMVGGLKAVMYNGAIQAVIVLIGGVVVTALAINDYVGEGETISSLVEESQLVIFNTKEQSLFHVVMFTIVAFFNGVWYWCSDQYIVQRTFSAKNIQSAQSGTIFAGFLKIALLFFFIFPGVLVAAKHQGIDAQNVYSTLVHDVVPIGLRGLVICALFAALMSSLASAFNTVSTIFTYDIYRRKFPKAAEFQLLNVGRLATMAIIIFSLVWVPFVPLMKEGVFTYLRLFQSLFGLQIAVIVMLGIFWSKPGNSSAIPTFFVGLVLSALKTYSNMITVENGKGFMAWLASVDRFAYFAFVILVIIAVYVSTALVNGRQNSLGSGLLTFGASSQMKELDVENLSVRKRWDSINRLMTFLLLGILVFLWIYFS